MVRSLNSNFTDITNKLANDSAGNRNITPAVEISNIISIIINSVTCPFTVALNVLVIMAVKRRPRLQTNANILLACLAVTDALTGLTSQPSFILWKVIQLLSMTELDNIMSKFHNSCLRTVSICSCLHLMLVTCERLIAIKFTVYYPYIVIKRNIAFTVIACWIISISIEVLNLANQKTIVKVLVGLVLNFCVLFVVFSYLLLYREARRHEKMIKTQQLPTEEVERFAKESKALKTTVYVVGAALLCLLPAAIVIALQVSGHSFSEPSIFFAVTPWIRTCGMSNSLMNPLIYYWRQREIRKFVFCCWTAQVVHPG